MMGYSRAFYRLKSKSGTNLFIDYVQFEYKILAIELITMSEDLFRRYIHKFRCHDLYH